jgi:hypothetical protein
MTFRQLTRSCFRVLGAVTLALTTLLLGCGGQSYNCGPGAPPCGTKSDQHCYGTVSWTGSFTGFSMELTAVALTSGDGFVDDEGWLVDYPGGSENGMSWVETGQINEGVNTDFSTDYFWAYGTDWCHPDEQFTWFDLGPVAQNDLTNNTWIAYKINQDPTTPSTWNITISYAQTGVVLFSETAPGVSMNPNTVTEGQELQGTNSAEAKLAFFGSNAFYKGATKTYWTTDGTVASGNPPHAGWWPGSKASETGNGGLFFTWCC